MIYLVSVYVGLLFGALLGALLGFGVQQINGQDGWALVVGALGACGGAFWAGMRRADNQPLWRLRRRTEPERTDRSEDAVAS